MSSHPTATHTGGTVCTPQIVSFHHVPLAQIGFIMVNTKTNKSFSYDLMKADYTSKDAPCIGDIVFMDRERVAEWKRCGHTSIVFEVSNMRDRWLNTPTAGAITFSANVTTTDKYGGSQAFRMSDRFAQKAFHQLDEATDLYGTTLPSLMSDIADELRHCAEVMKELADVVLNPHPRVHG